MSAGELIIANWVTQFRAIRLLADETERRILEECEHAAARLRVREMSPSLANQIWQRQ